MPFGAWLTHPTAPVPVAAAPAGYVRARGVHRACRRGRHGPYVQVDSDEPAAHGCIVAVRADSPGSATLARLMAVESARSVPRVAGPGRPGIAVTRASETIMRAVAVYVGRARSEAQRPVTTGRRPEAAEVVFCGLSPGGGIR